MRATELLAALAVNVDGEDYEGLFIELNRNLLPVTNLIQQDDRLIFLSDRNLPAIPISEFFTTLMMNKQLKLYTQVDELTPLYGFKEVENKIVL